LVLAGSAWSIDLSITMPTDVIVVGAGAAGLAAASKLAAGGLDVLVLEARERIGGRILTERLSGLEAPIELGAEFIHGEAKPIRQIATEHHLAMLDIAGQHLIGGSRRLSTMTGFWQRLGRVLHRFDANRRIDRSVADALRANRHRISALDRALAIQFIEGFEAADTTEMSERAIAEAGAPGDDVRESRLGRLEAGYQSLIESLATGLEARIRLDAVVSGVHWRSGHVDVECRNLAGTDPPRLSARALVVTVPVGVLAAPASATGAIVFDPPVSSMERAIERTAMGAVVRLVVRFDRAFWLDRGFAERRGQPSLDQVSFLHARGRVPFPVWWTSYPVFAPLLVAWVGGPTAQQLSRLPIGEREARAISSLAAILRMSPTAVRARIAGVFHHDWVNDPFARGAYSYSRVGGYRSPQELARPVHDTLWFAGEAADRQSTAGTVHGAIASGWRAADQILRRLT
jgi:monoamine oxidase